ncbi:MAG: LysM peptidoglycan-binding domain-containing protein [Campylobacterota bacterium]|nr:LysM peptidoglycan-binding domain-containing protein [Campylobacterota bacterium]
MRTIGIYIKIILLFCSVGYLNAALVSTAFIQNDIRILEELDIQSSYITDYKLQKELNKRLKHTKKGYTRKLNNAYLFVPQIKKILRENNIPSAFLYLVMAESNFVLDAQSNKKAKGLWQFMPKTGEHYGLETNKFIDERMDILKSTKAAVTYLKLLHKMFGKWYLAAVAYNCGEGRVIEGITRATIDMHCESVGYKVCRNDKKINLFRQTIRDYQSKRVKFRKLNKIYKEVKKWEQKPDIEQLLVVQSKTKRQYLPNESRNYIRKIISLALMNNSDFLIKDENTHLLNRGISDPIASIDVKGGILLRNVAKLIGVDKNKLKELNQHIKKDILPLDREYYTLYIPYSKLSRYNLNKDNLIATKFERYVVKSGDTLGQIARTYGVDYTMIKKHNRLKSNIININQELFIPTTLDKYNQIDEYIVKVGDTLNKIASKHKVDLKRLMDDNHLKTSMIKIGDKIVIKYE